MLRLREVDTVDKSNLERKRREKGDMRGTTVGEGHGRVGDRGER